jgi:CPA2 family monovalent cation:H+ antiporter-2
VGSVVVRALRARGFRCIVVDRDQRALDALASAGAATLFGDAANPAILRRVGLDRARLAVVAIGDPLAARLAVERMRAINPRLNIIARAHGRSEIAGLGALGVRRVADPDLEAALELTRASLARMGVSGPEQTAIVLGIRRRTYGDAAGSISGSGAEERGPGPAVASDGEASP